jgi:hypothetical protein
MYYISPFTYLVQGMLAVGVANTEVVCESYEYLKFSPPLGINCGLYMAPWIKSYGGKLLDDNSRTECNFCPLSSTNSFLASVNANYSNRWRNFGIMFIYIFFNVFAALFLYWLVRVPKKTARTKEINTADESVAKTLSHKSQESLDAPVVAPADKSTEFGSEKESTLPPHSETKDHDLDVAKSDVELTKTGQDHPTKQVEQVEADEKKPL